SGAHVPGMAGARDSSLRRTGDGGADGAPPDAGDHRRRLPRPARNQFLAGPGSDADRARAFADGLPAAMGPERLLRDAGGDGNRRRHAAHRPTGAATDSRRTAIRAPYADSVLRAAYGRASG